MKNISVPKKSTLSRLSQQGQTAIDKFFTGSSLGDHLRNLDDVFCCALQDELFQQNSSESFFMLMQIKELLIQLSPKK